MSIHPSLSISEKDKKQRSVLKRSERIKTMIEKGEWKEGDEIYGLPKIKTIRIRVKKEKAEKTEAAGAVEAAAPSAAETKEQAQTKQAVPKADKTKAAEKK
ncbi:MAG: small basic protein [Candidatus Omnitrophica bacterium]|nr:small basic protein [Candidatus Omnitrophota bacterium]